MARGYGCGNANSSALPMNWASTSSCITCHRAPANGTRSSTGALLQEGRDYADGTRLEVQDSARGGRGRDVFLIDSAGSQKTWVAARDQLS